jgi:phosphatidylglycerophosphate synthase
MQLLTWANLLSALRLAAALPCAYAVSIGNHWLAAALFVVAVVTDVADGRVARWRGEVSHFGGLLDHSSDAIFVSVALAALAASGHVPALLPVLVIISFVQYTLDSRALTGQALRASRLGRWNGIGYFVLAGVPIIRDALDLVWPPSAWVMAAGWLLVVSTLISMADRGHAFLRSRRSKDRTTVED